jgi:hypothetical protein
VRGLITLALILTAGSFRIFPLAAQPATAPDTVQLRSALAAELGASFEIVRAELRTARPERAGTFWLVHLRPSQAGHYRLRYTYEYRDRVRPNDPLYTHVEHSSILRIGAQGCWRRHEGKDACLGDVLIVPVVVGDDRGHFTGHVFTVTPLAVAAGPPPPARSIQNPPGDETIANPAAPHLRYLSTHVEEMPHRNGGSTTIRYARFAAEAPGSLNLAVRSSASGSTVQGGAPGSTPIVIVPRGHPVTVLLANERVRAYDETGRFASHRGNQYLATVRILQPGDRIELPFHTTSIHGHAPPADEPAAADGFVPVVSVSPLQIPAQHGFNAWIMDEICALSPCPDDR